MKVMLENKTLSLNSSQVVGKGGEADIYSIGNGEVLKIFKDKNHPDLRGQSIEQENARLRIIEHQTKLPAFPKNMPDKVIRPKDMIYQKERIVGYSMDYLESAEPIMMYSKKGFHLSGVSDDMLRNVFLSMHNTLQQIHKRGAIIGDYNDLNILTKDNEAFFIDVDSWQYAEYKCHVYTAKFLDPLLAGKNAQTLEPRLTFNQDSDWYAYLVMLFQSLLFVDPYGGVYRPKDKKKQIIEAKRPLKRISVFDASVRYPKPARHYKILSDDLLQFFYEALHEDRRGEFPKYLLDIEWRECQVCGLKHARMKCPDCFEPSKESKKESLTVHGKIKARQVFRTQGLILSTRWQNGLQILYHEDGVYYREGARKVLSGPLQRGVRYLIQGENTVFGKADQLVILKPDARSEKISIDSLAGLSIMDAAKDNVFYLQNGDLYRTDEYAPLRIGTAIKNQSLFWIGDKYGFGYYRAGRISEAFVFRARAKGLRYLQNFQFPGGQLVDSCCYFSGENIWFFLSMKKGAHISNFCFLIRGGQVLAQHESLSGDGSWLGEIRSGLAIGDFLLVATDTGIVRIEKDGKFLTKTKTFADTAKFVQSDSKLIAGDNGLFVIGQREINHIELLQGDVS